MSTSTTGSKSKATALSDQLLAVVDEIDGVRLQQDELLTLLSVAIYNAEDPENPDDPDAKGKAINRLYAIARALRAELTTLEGLEKSIRPAMDHLAALGVASSSKKVEAVHG